MRAAIELGLEVDDGEGHGEEIDSVASPSQPTKNGSRSKPDKFRHPGSPREKETPLRKSEASDDFQQRSRALYFLSLGHKVSQEVGRHRRGLFGRGTKRGREEGERGSRKDPEL